MARLTTSINQVATSAIKLSPAAFAATFPSHVQNPWTKSAATVLSFAQLIVPDHAISLSPPATAAAATTASTTTFNTLDTC